MTSQEKDGFDKEVERKREAMLMSSSINNVQLREDLSGEQARVGHLKGKELKEESNIKDVGKSLSPKSRAETWEQIPSPSL